MRKMLLNTIIRREINRQRPAVPFSLRIADQMIKLVQFRSSHSESASSNEEPSRGDSDHEIKDEDKSTITKNKSVSLEDNPFYSKYSEKIRKAQESKGVQTQKSLEANVHPLDDISLFKET